ncbi:MAG: M48 family metallopeptidase [Gemmatimonadales bacterium]
MNQRPGPWIARYSSGPESMPVPVTVTVDRLGIHFQLPGKPPSWWPYSVVRASADADNPAHTRVERGDDGEALVVLEPGFLDTLESRSPRAQPSPHGVSSSGWPKVAMLVVGSLGLVAALYYVALPAIAGVVANRVSVEFERELGDGVIEQLLEDEPVCDDPVLTRSIGALVARLQAALPDDRYDFRVTIVDDTLVNALAVPGGAMVVFRGLLRNSTSPEEVAGVLAHEMQHVQLRHGTRAIMRQLPLLMGGGGDAGAVLGVLGALSYARADEEEADREGMRLVMAAQIDPRGMISFFDTLERIAEPGSPALTYLSTHPATSERRAALVAMADARPATIVPITGVGDVPWTELVERCRAR